MPTATETATPQRPNTGAKGLPQRGGTPGDKRYGRSKVTNGTKLLQGVPETSRYVRRCRDLIAQYESDIPDASVGEQWLIRCAAVLKNELEQLEARFATIGSSPDTLDLYQRTSANMRRHLESVGLKRRAKDVGGGLADLLRQDDIDRRAKAAAETTTIDADEAPHGQD